MRYSCVSVQQVWWSTCWISSRFWEYQVFLHHWKGGYSIFEHSNMVLFLATSPYHQIRSVAMPNYHIQYSSLESHFCFIMTRYCLKDQAARCSDHWSLTWCDKLENITLKMKMASNACCCSTMNHVNTACMLSVDGKAPGQVHGLLWGTLSSWPLFIQCYKSKMRSQTTLGSAHDS